MSGQVPGGVEVRRFIFSGREEPCIRLSDLSKVEGQIRSKLREDFISELESGGWNADGDIPGEEVGLALDRVVDRASLDGEFDAAIEASEGKEGHSVKFDFDDGLATTLIHPEGGCKPPTVCVHCASDLTDPESKRCYDCKGIDPDTEECWLTAWVDEQGDELVRGSVTLPVEVEWCNDYPLFRLPEQPEATQ